MLKSLNAFNHQKNIILKAGDFGTLETMQQVFNQIGASEEEKNLALVKAEVGPVTEHDINMSRSFEGIIMTMGLPELKEKNKIENDNKIKIEQFNIIYKFLERLEELNESNTIESHKLAVVGSGIIEKTFHVSINEKSKIFGFIQ